MAGDESLAPVRVKVARVPTLFTTMSSNCTEPPSGTRLASRGTRAAVVVGATRTHWVRATELPATVKRYNRQEMLLSGSTGRVHST